MATWNLSTGSVFGNALTAGITCAAVVAVADTIGMHPIAGAGAAVVGALCTVLMSGFSNAEAIGVHLVRWLAAGVWVTVMMSLSSPWSLWSIGILAAGCVVGAAMGQMVRRRAAAAGRRGAAPWCWGLLHGRTMSGGSGLWTVVVSRSLVWWWRLSPSGTTGLVRRSGMSAQGRCHGGPAALPRPGIGSGCEPSAWVLDRDH